jgi:hypothetical protein
MSIIRRRSRTQVPTSTHLKLVVEEQEGQITLVRGKEMSIIRGQVQDTGAHQHSPEGCDGGAGGADHPAEGGGDVYHQG